MNIDFNNMGGPVYSGRDRGEINRAKFELDNIDASNGMSVDVIIPDNAYAVTSSFFLGLFGESIATLGSREVFFQKYNFRMPEKFRPHIDAYIERALRENRPILG